MWGQSGKFIMCFFLLLLLSCTGGGGGSIVHNEGNKFELIPATLSKIALN